MTIHNVGGPRPVCSSLKKSLPRKEFCLLSARWKFRLSFQPSFSRLKHQRFPQSPASWTALQTVDLQAFIIAWASLGGSVVKNPPANAGGAGLIPESGRSPGGRNSNSLQYSCLENPRSRGAWQTTVHRVTRSRT